MKQQQPIASDDQVPNTNIEPILVFLLNFLFLGLGHIVMGQAGKGITYIVLNIFFYFLIVVLMFVFIGICVLPFWVIWWVMIQIDGVTIASRLKEGKVVKKGECASSIAKLGVSIFEKTEVFVQ
ncbi:hypothetical protein NAEGRDRAFT_80787 [Naegleria gruberi]|uniref:TM2 domain-containing protein n=1 Tax=Naegleria gruberi TaxID=5762 RepID=D2VPT9_NAEGR|nr:uncharacterized protein NAEGRDRAFT_80787 [Naegleria gruberi]EFC41264.1 hypothetical protein NAEGRDRAFT_80787 [Naegleria gruberi]|eukprot:XP_002674008.1 hypothetical protein NAEGRDRAFT_80787 [Naegleria gruberi strain NEG-M]